MMKIKMSFCPHNITQLQCFEDCLCCSGPNDMILVSKCQGQNYLQLLWIHQSPDWPFKGSKKSKTVASTTCYNKLTPKCLEYKFVMPSHQSIPTKRIFSDLQSASENYLKEKHHMYESYARSSNATMKVIQRTEHSKYFDEFTTSSEWMSQLCF